MSDTLMAIVVGVGVGGWAYFQLSRRTGGSDPKSLTLTSLIIGVMAGVFVFTVAHFTLHH